MTKITCICCGVSINENKLKIHNLSNSHINNMIKEIRKNKNSYYKNDRFYEWFNEPQIIKDNDKFYEWFNN